MISLLPPDYKRDIGAARANTVLIRYNILLLATFAFLLMANGVVYAYLTTTKASGEKTIEENQTKVSSFSAVEAQASVFRQNLATAKQILDREVNYTKVILEVAQLMPAGTILTNLTLDSATFGTETVLIAKARSYDQALVLKDAFTQSSLFTNVHFQSINSADSAADGYPVTVNINVTFKKEAAKT
jgi:hypothetical protein